MPSYPGSRSAAPRESGDTRERYESVLILSDGIKRHPGRRHFWQRRETAAAAKNIDENANIEATFFNVVSRMSIYAREVRNLISSSHSFLGA